MLGSRKSFFDLIQQHGGARPPAPPPSQDMQPAPWQAPPRKLGTAEKIGLAGDIWAGNDYTRQRLAEEYTRQAAQREAYQPQKLGENIVRLNPQTGQFETMYSAPQKPAAPYRWESNDGDLYELGTDGRPKQVFDDPTPKQNFIPDGMGGGKWVAVPSAADAAPVGSVKPVGKLTPIQGGPTQPRRAPFP